MAASLHRLILSAFWVTLFVLLAEPATMAQQQCSSVYSTASRDAIRLQSFRALRLLYNSAGQLIHDVQSSPGTITFEQFTTEVQRLETLAKTYFEKAGISYEPHEVRLAVRGLKGEPAYRSIEHVSFQLTGSAHGDDFSRMIFGTRSDPAVRQAAVQFHFDPLYELRNPGDHGHFSSDTMQVGLGSFALLFKALNLGDTPRHEIQHYFEFLKLVNGEMTLVRFGFENFQILSDEDYAVQLSGDELETHLRDLRGLMEKVQTSEPTRALSTDLSAESIQRNKDNRVSILKQTMKRAKRLARDTIQSFENIEKQFSQGGSWAAENISKEGKSQIVTFKLGRGEAYPIVKLDLRGLLSSEALHSKEGIRQTVLEVLSWSHKRAIEIETELKAMSLQAKLDSE